MLLTRLPLGGESTSSDFHELSKLASLLSESVGRLVRLACLRHAASVHPEPGSNSHKKKLLFKFNLATQNSFLTFYLVFKDHFRCLFHQRISNISNFMLSCQHFFYFFLTFSFIWYFTLFCALFLTARFKLYINCYTLSTQFLKKCTFFKKSRFSPYFRAFQSNNIGWLVNLYRFINIWFDLHVSYHFS